MSISLSAEARARLDVHLDAVERVLVAAGNTREQRCAVADDLEAQISEMLAARSAMPSPTDVEAVLAELDPPEAYGAGEANRMRNPRPRETAAKKEDTTAKRRQTMKANFLVALVICGTLLVLTPAISDQLHERNIVALLAKSETGSVNIGYAMGGEGTRFGFWFTGSLTITCAVIGGFRSMARDWRREQ